MHYLPTNIYNWHCIQYTSAPKWKVRRQTMHRDWQVGRFSWKPSPGYFKIIVFSLQNSKQGWVNAIQVNKYLFWSYLVSNHCKRHKSEQDKWHLPLPSVTGSAFQIRDFWSSSLPFPFPLSWPALPGWFPCMTAQLQSLPYTTMRRIFLTITLIGYSHTPKSSMAPSCQVHISHPGIQALPYLALTCTSILTFHCVFQPFRLLLNCSTFLSTNILHYGL